MKETEGAVRIATSICGVAVIIIAAVIGFSEVASWLLSISALIMIHKASA